MDDLSQKKTTGTCIATCKHRFNTVKERIACVHNGCGSLFRDRISRIKKDVEIPDASYENDPEENEERCRDSCRFTFTSLDDASACIEKVCMHEVKEEEEDEPRESSEVAGKRPSSACKGMCQAKYFSIQARLDCMDNKCAGMYRSRVGRMKREAALLTGMSEMQLTCFAMCDENHSELKDKMQCIKSYDCRGIYRDRIGRLGKISVEDEAIAKQLVQEKSKVKWVKKEV